MAESKEGEIDLFAGHLGHLTAIQEESFSTFKKNLLQAGLYIPSIGTGNASHDEPTLLRFLRARQFNPTEAQRQFSDTEDWRKQHNVDNLFATFDPEEFEDCRRFYPRWTGRRDRQGLPVYVYRLASLAPLQKELDAIPASRRYQRIIALYEAMIRMSPWEQCGLYEIIYNKLPPSLLQTIQKH